jgi:hypothetical protein
MSKRTVYEVLAEADQDHYADNELVQDLVKFLRQYMTLHEKYGFAATQQSYAKYAAEIVTQLGYEPGQLQWKWRSPDNFDFPKNEIIPAILDALCREGCVAWPGDGTSCVEQMITRQIDLREKGTK